MHTLDYFIINKETWQALFSIYGSDYEISTYQNQTSTPKLNNNLQIEISQKGFYNLTQ